MSKTYVDDNTFAIRALDTGVRFDAEKMKMVVVQEFVESDKDIPEDKRTMEELTKIANTVYDYIPSSFNTTKVQSHIFDATLLRIAREPALD